MIAHHETAPMEGYSTKPRLLSKSKVATVNGKYVMLLGQRHNHVIRHGPVQYF